MDDIVIIELFGDTYKFRTEEGVENPKLVTDHLIKEIQKVEGQLTSNSPYISRFTLLLQAALNISNEYFKLKNRYDILIENISVRQESLNQKLDQYTK